VSHDDKESTALVCVPERTCGCMLPCCACIAAWLPASPPICLWVHAAVLCMQSSMAPSKSGAALWEPYLISTGWRREWDLQLELSEGEWFQIKGDSAVAASLCAFLHHGLLAPSAQGGRPEDAIVAAVHYGGDTDTVAAMCGKKPFWHLYSSKKTSGKTCFSCCGSAVLGSNVCCAA